ncbi:MULTISPECIES: septum site-determining protein MinC [Mangrovibacter]|uniref:Probable septum site-determining protein MinC n=1 Tax=Mangrovibacter plantisponsor TaxID=451513 RepID=A0A317Q282_9ENTR|nr:MULTISPECIES: septum site-determining protein MinC [Mangrovibacter]KEA52963.1 septum formation inhibitor [Mangrovibacter sp. MFB070]PWW07623.1 septum site-determining protein MinC [Mangrovibacter plantisponsor]
MSNSPIELKGSSFTLSVVHLHDANPALIRKALEDKVAQAPAFLKNAPVVVNVADVDGAIIWQQVNEAVSASGLHVVGVSGSKNPQLKAQVEMAGLPLLTEGVKPTRPAREAKQDTPLVVPEATVHRTRLIDTPVRSGQRIYAQHSDLVVTNHVSAGAELIADGNIHVYGTMRGRALAGAAGDKDAQIFCTHLVAELVSIGGVYWLSDQVPTDYYGKAARLKLVGGALTVQPLY